MARLTLPIATFAFTALLSAAPVILNVGIPGDLLVAPCDSANSRWLIEFTAGDPALRVDSVTIRIASRVEVNAGSCALSGGCGFNSAMALRPSATGRPPSP